MSSDNELFSGIANGIVVLIIVCLIIAIFLLYKAINLVIRVFTKYPQVKALWIVLALTIGFPLLAVVLPQVLPATADTQTIEEIATGLAAISAGALLVICRVVEVYYDEVFIKEPEPLVTQMLHRPWGEGKEEPEEELAAAA